MTLRIGIIGAGAIAGEHAKAFAQLGCDLRVVMSPDAASAATFAGRHGVARSTAELDELLYAEDVDAVVIASPTPHHAEQVLATLAAGKHVLAEIPLATSLSEATQIRDLARGRDLHCMVCHTQRYVEPMLRLADGIGAGTINPIHVGITRAMLRRQNRGWTGIARSWADDVLWHHGAHAIDTTMTLLGFELEITGHAGRPLAGGGKPLDVSLSVATSDGRLGTILLSYNSLMPLNEILLIAEDDGYRFREGELRNAAGELLAGGTDEVLLKTAMYKQNSEFIDGLLRGRPMRTSVERVQPVYAALQSVATRFEWS
jgi:2-hydroxy-4-carboxymuconate semialdehyde hemiacetal dehydrogenase